MLGQDKKVVEIRSTAASNAFSTGKTSRNGTSSARSGSVERAQAFVPSDAFAVTSGSPGTSRQDNMAAEGGLSIEVELALYVTDV